MSHKSNKRIYFECHKTLHSGTQESASNRSISIRIAKMQSLNETQEAECHHDPIAKSNQIYIQKMSCF